MSSAGWSAIESIKKEVDKLDLKVNELRIEDKAGWVFFIAGLLLLSTGFIIISLVYRFIANLVLVFFLGFISLEFLTIGYSLIHKSLRGAWL
ncbi:hypothetical protein GF352_01120 [archaeon]|nr:hypothetical protein [archaeon]